MSPSREDPNTAILVTVQGGSLPSSFSPLYVLLQRSLLLFFTSSHLLEQWHFIYRLYV